MKKIFVSFALIMLVVFSTACRAKSEAEMYSNDAWTVAETMAAADYGSYDVAAEEAAGFAMKNSTAEFPQEGMGEAEAQAYSESRKLIRTIEITLQTEKFEEVTARIKNNITKYGGYIENSGIYYGSGSYSVNRNANITARIPADKTDEFLNNSFQDAYITNMSENTEDVSLKYTDLESRLSSLKTEQTRLLELLAKAEDVESLIALESRLTEIRYEIEKIQSNLKSYDNKITYSTVFIYINEVKTAQASTEDSFMERVSAGFKNSTRQFLEGIEDFAVWFLSNIVTIIFDLLILIVLILLLKKLIKKIKAKKCSPGVKKEDKNDKKSTNSSNSDNNDNNDNSDNSNHRVLLAETNEEVKTGEHENA